ncbi:MAG: hypothetical protein H7259_05360 [Cytophagales bacterium]|nr:hypothetical protein [Cytophaga sp.]
MDFSEPQPVSITNIHAFNKKYQGVYIQPEDSSRLIVLSDKLISLEYFHIVSSRNDLDSSFEGDQSSNEQITEWLAKENIQVTGFKGDSIYSIWIIKDTIFIISDLNICRFLKGSYFLNHKYDAHQWKVQRMSLHKNRLSIGMIQPGDSLFHTVTIADKNTIKDDSGSVVNYQINPTKKELKKLIKANAFSNWKEYIRE